MNRPESSIVGLIVNLCSAWSYTCADVWVQMSWEACCWWTQNCHCNSYEEDLTLFDRGKLWGSSSYFSVPRISSRPHCAHQYGLSLLFMPLPLISPTPECLHPLQPHSRYYNFLKVCCFVFVLFRLLFPFEILTYKSGMFMLKNMWISKIFAWHMLWCTQHQQFVMDVDILKPLEKCAKFLGKMWQCDLLDQSAWTVVHCSAPLIINTSEYIDIFAL